MLDYQSVPFGSPFQPRMRALPLTHADNIMIKCCCCQQAIEEQRNSRDKDITTIEHINSESHALPLSMRGRSSSRVGKS